jgi:hypothetical protein
MCCVKNYAWEKLTFFRLILVKQVLFALFQVSFQRVDIMQIAARWGDVAQH